MTFSYIAIDNQLIEQAKKEAKRRMEFGFRGPIIETQYKANMILISCIGELIMQRFLDSKGIAYKNVDSNFSGRELIINSKKYEIRTSGFEKDFTRLNLIYNVEQYSESLDKGIDYVLQIFINGYKQNSNGFEDSNCNKAIIVGYIDFDLIGKYPIEQNRHRPNYKVPLDDLIDVGNILKSDI
jgi:hypothetical protein